MQTVDMRSDTVTRPTPTMLEAMTTAELGDDVLGDDPTVLRLQERVYESVMVLAAAIIIPIGEELFYRGFALTAWMRDLGERTALILATVFFAVVHIVNIDAATFGQGLAQGQVGRHDRKFIARVHQLGHLDQQAPLQQVGKGRHRTIGSHPSGPSPQDRCPWRGRSHSGT